MKYENAFSDPNQIHKSLIINDLNSSSFYSGINAGSKINARKFIHYLLWIVLIFCLTFGYNGNAAVNDLINDEGRVELSESVSTYGASSLSPVLPPVAICRNITISLGPDGTATVAASQVDGGSYDPDGTITSRTVTPGTFNCSQLGSNTVTFTVADDEGLSSSCTATILVTDKTPPSVVCRNTTLYLDLSGEATLVPADVNNGSSDNCLSGFFLYLSKTKFSCSDLGNPVQVTLTGTDGTGNLSSCTAQVTVLDTISPKVFVKPFELVLSLSGTATLLPENVDNGSFDNCGPVTLSVLPDSFTCSDLGPKTVTLTATDSYGNSSSRKVTITVSTDLQIKGMSLSSCDMTPTLALFQANVEGGSGSYSYFWKGLDETKRPFMEIITFPPSVHFFNSSTLASPYFNNNIPDNLYDIRLVVTDGNGCRDTAEISIRKTGPVFNNQTIRKSVACEGETETYSVHYNSTSTYTWSVVNGTILNSDPDTSMISVRWNTGITEGIVSAVVAKRNPVFPGGDCEATVVDSVAIIPVPIPVFSNPDLNVCSQTTFTYTLTNSFNNYLWTITGGIITGGGTGPDNYVTVKWGDGPTGSIMVSAGNTLSCSGAAMISISVNNLSGTIISRADVTCNGFSDGTVTAGAVTGTGTPPFQYSLDGGSWQASGVFNALSPGNHSVTVRDAMLCTFDLPFAISQPVPVYGTLAGWTDVSCFGGSNGSASISASGGMAPYQYRLGAGALQGSNIFNNLAAGTYTVTIVDNNGCQGTVNFTITQPVSVLSVAATVTNVNCYGASTGAVNLDVSGGVPPYTYLWNNGLTTRDISNIPASDYTVIVTDSRGCILTVNSQVTQPAAALSGRATISNVLCFGESTGTIDLTASGGVAPYTFLWSNGANTEDISNLAAGTYAVTVTDANGCTSIFTGTVTQPLLPVNGSVTSQTNVSCTGENNGGFTVLGSGGTEPFDYNIDGGMYQTSGTFNGLSAVGHTVTVRDKNLCTYILPITITEPIAPLGAMIVAQNSVKCYGGSSGSVTITGTGGTSPYNYSIDAGTYQQSGLFENLGAGTHIVAVRDANLCQDIIMVNINQPSMPLSVAASKTDVICRGGSTGRAEAFPSGGTSPYSFSWNTLPVQTGSAATGLTAGTYIVTVTDSNGCIASTSILVSQPATSFSANTSVTNAFCYGSATGAVNLTVLNGTAPVTYLWSNGATTEDLTGLGAGIYSVAATDANGCTASASAIIGQPAELTGNIAVTNIGCAGASSGSADLNVSGGVSPYGFLWSNGATSEDISNLAPGTYSVKITDANNCKAVVSCTIIQPSTALGGTITAQSDVTVYGENDGSITVSGTGGSGPYEYRLGAGNYQVSGTFNSLFAGLYTITIRDAGSCTFNIDVTISQPSIPLTGRILSQSGALCNSEETGSVTVSGWGGTSPYDYSIDGTNFQTSGTFSLLGAGLDTIIVRDALLDIYEIPINITEPDALGITISSTNALCIGGASGTATVNVTGGTGPYIYEWNTSPSQTSATATGLNAGSYTVSVTDSNGCNTTGSVVILQPSEEISITFTQVNPYCAGGANGSATAQVIGGTGPYAYSWDTSPEQTSSTATSLGAGSYTVTITDFNGCTKSGSVAIAEPESIVLDHSTTVASCPDAADGSITLTVSGGTSPYNFIWSDGAITQNRTNVKPGTYSVVVTDRNSCAKALEAEVDFTGTFNCVEIPQIITPNNDGYNDTWILKNIDLYPDAEMLVFNRWGKLVFRTKNISDNPWDGRSDGKLVPTDSYHYILYLNDGSEPKSGVISVIR